MYIFYSYELHGKETSVKTATKKRADQPVHPGIQISKFLAPCLDSIYIYIIGNIYREYIYIGRNETNIKQKSKQKSSR